jgi:formamidase
VATHEIRIDSSRPLGAEPGTGHNRWHPDIRPVVRCKPGDEVLLETRDALDGQITRRSTVADVGKTDLNLVHPLTGPVHIDGAEPGDVLVCEILEVVPDSFGFTVQIPGFGFLRDDFPEPYLAKWEIDGTWAVSEDIRGVRVPGAPFMGTIGLAPSRELLGQITSREAALIERGGFALPPEPAGAVPAEGTIAREALRTVPPRENVGNVDIKQLCAGTRLLMPVWTQGALFSAGDAHFAQGDCETCGTAVEMRSTLRVRFDLRKGEAAARNLRDLRFERDDYYLPPEFAAPRRFFATTGMSIARDGSNLSEDLTAAARNALLNMIDHLTHEYGYTRPQAYAICSVAVDLKVSELVDVPNFVISAFLPLDIFT